MQPSSVLRFAGDVTINKIHTEVTDDYYHSVGIGTINSKGEKKFEDVYSLTRVRDELLPQLKGLKKQAEAQV